MRQEVTPEAHPVEIGTNTQVEQMRLAGPERDDAIADGLLARTQDPATVADTQTIPEYSRRPREFVAARLNGGNIIDVCPTGVLTFGRVDGGGRTVALDRVPASRVQMGETAR